MNKPLDFERDGRDWPHRDASRFVDTGRVRFHVQTFGLDRGPRRKPVLLLVHGTGSSTHSWRRIIPFLEDEFAIVSPDLPGHAFTSNPGVANLTLAAMAQDLSDLMQKLSIQPDVAVGHSAGAAIAIRMALDGRIRPRVIVSLNGALFPFGGTIGQVLAPLTNLIVTRPWVAQLMAWRAQSTQAVERLLKNTGSAVSAEDVALYQKLFQNEGHVAAVLAMMANWELRPMVKDIARLTIPLTLVAGTNDLAIPPEQADAVARIAPKSMVKWLTGLGHLAHEERPDIVAPVIFGAAAEGLTLP